MSGRGGVELSRRGGTGAYEEVGDVGLIEVSSTHGDYALVNLEQVAWATVDTNETGGASRITLHMADGATFMLRGAEAEGALEGLRTDLGQSPRDPGLPP
jgi:hypothetical protein